MKKIDTVGRKFGSVFVISEQKEKVNNKIIFLCLCICGNKFTSDGYNIRAEKVRHCGCLTSQNLVKARTTHGMSYSKEYRTWEHIKDRCLREGSKDYKDYGGRGISVCNDWINSFKSFLDHVGVAPDSTHVIDRIDNDKGYEPGNVRWTTQKESSSNRRSSKRWNIFGISYRTAQEASEVHGVSRRTIANWCKSSPKCFSTFLYEFDDAMGRSKP